MLKGTKNFIRPDLATVKNITRQDPDVDLSRVLHAFKNVKKI